MIRGTMCDDFDPCIVRITPFSSTFQFLRDAVQLKPEKTMDPP